MRAARDPMIPADVSLELRGGRGRRGFRIQLETWEEEPKRQ